MTSNNSLTPSYFQFTVFADYGPLRYLFFSLSLLIYMTVISVNVVIVLSVCLENSLHQPMYIFICSLCLNSLYGSTGFFPRFLMDLLSDTHFISHPLCFIEMYITTTYLEQELSLLTVMAYDRFVAICQPLHYHSKMTFRTVLLLLILAVLYPVCAFGYFFYQAIILPLCGEQLPRIICTIWVIIKLSCVDTTVKNIGSQIFAIISVFIPMLFVLYTYLHILLVCRRSSSEFRGKALQTCLPHIVSFGNFCISLFSDFSLSWYSADEVNTLAIVLSLEFLIIPPIMNPLVYGLNLPRVRGVIFGFLRAEKMVC
uniref:LOW QUALITY PROTEIN: olfactory receptor 10J5-like n=1 Tax=Monopterus albus TaxID=43700 RepID=UPI0009B333E3|nr:LOW QUALITY PROTEIN: olfactory receptor 10J5-like [Monopterus albus]